MTHEVYNRYVNAKRQGREGSEPLGFVPTEVQKTKIPKQRMSSFSKRFVLATDDGAPAY